MKFDAGTTISGTWTFTNGSTTVTAVGGAALTELAVNNYIRVSTGIQWYKVSSITDDNTITLNITFQQATITDIASSTLKNAGDGSSSNPFCHLNQYTTNTTRTPGDILYIQTGEYHTYSGITINHDEDGNSNNLLTVTSSDWNSTTNITKPTIDFNDTTSYSYLGYDGYWQYDNCEFLGGSYSQYVNNQTTKNFFKNSIFRSSTIYGFRASGRGICVIENCEFYDNTTYNAYFTQDSYIYDSTFNGGSVSGTTHGIYCTQGVVNIINTTFGQTTPHSSNDIYVANNGKVVLVNSLFNESKVYIYSLGAYVKSYDHQQIRKNYWEKQYHGIIQSETVETRIGGGDTSIKVTPNFNIGTNNPLKVLEWNEFDVPVSAQTRSVYIKSKGIATTFPTNTQLWLEAEYLDTTSSTIIKSTESLSIDNTWVSFSVTFTPAQIGRVIYRVYLAYYEGAEAYYIDNQLN